MKSPLNVQIGGSHYKKYEKQPVEFFLEQEVDFACANAIKYLCRLGVEKDKGTEGLDKAAHYIRLFREFVENSRPKVKRYNPADVIKFLNQFEPEVATIIRHILVLSSLQYAYVKVNGKMIYDEQAVINETKYILSLITTLKKKYEGKENAN